MACFWKPSQYDDGVLDPYRWCFVMISSANFLFDVQDPRRNTGIAAILFLSRDIFVYKSNVESGRTNRRTDRHPWIEKESSSCQVIIGRQKGNKRKRNDPAPAWNGMTESPSSAPRAVIVPNARSPIHIN